MSGRDRGSLLWLWILLAAAGAGVLVVCLGVGGCVLLVGRGAKNAVQDLKEQNEQAKQELATEGRRRQLTTEDDTPESKNLKGIQVQRTAKKFVTRGRCEIGDYFNYEFRGTENTYYNVKLTQITRADGALVHAHLDCYLLRDSADGKRVFELLGKGEKQMLTVECELVRGVDMARLVRVVNWE